MKFENEKNELFQTFFSTLMDLFLLQNGNKTFFDGFFLLVVITADDIDLNLINDVSFIAYFKTHKKSLMELKRLMTWNDPKLDLNLMSIDDDHFCWNKSGAIKLVHYFVSVYISL